MSDNLPELMSKASRRLVEAKTSAELLEAHDYANAALHVAKVTGAANETQGDCLRMVVRAEIHMANAVDDGQAKGQLAGKGQRRNVRDADICDQGEIGIDRRRLNEWREQRDTGEERINDAIDTAIANGKAPTKADVKRAAKKPEPKPKPRPKAEPPAAAQAISQDAADVIDALVRIPVNRIRAVGVAWEIPDHMLPRFSQDLLAAMDWLEELAAELSDRQTQRAPENPQRPHIN